MPTDDVQKLIAVVEARSAQAEKQMDRFVRAAEKRMKDVEKSTAASAARVEKAWSGAFGRLGTYMTGFISLYGVRAAARFADSWTSASNKLAAIGVPIGEVAGRMDELVEVANRSRSDLDATVALYARLAMNAQTLGLSLDDVLQITETVQKAMAVGGATTSEAAAATRQLAQALGSGVLRGDEFNSIMENAPIIAQAIAAEFGTTTDKLRAMAEDGELSADRVAEALLNASGSIGQSFDQTKSTIDQAWTTMANTMTQIIGRFNDATDAANILAASINGVAWAMDNLSKYGFVDAIINAAGMTRAQAEVAALRNEIESYKRGLEQLSMGGTGVMSPEYARQARKLAEAQAALAAVTASRGWGGVADAVAAADVLPRPKTDAPLGAGEKPREDLKAAAAGAKAAAKETEALAKASAKAAENARELGKDMLAAFGEDARDELVRTTQAVEDAAQAAADFKDSFKSDFVQSFKYALTTGDLAGAAANFGMSIADRMLERLAEQAFDVLWESGFGEGMNALFGDADLAQAALASSASAASASVTTMTAAANAAATALMRLAMTPVQSGSSGGLGGILANGLGLLFGMGGAVSGGAGGLAANGIGLLGRRALGGPVMAGTPYMVGERGPEPFVPAVNGRILSVQQAQQAIRGGGGGPVFAPVINMPGADSAAVARMAAEMDAQRREFQSWAASEGARIRGHVNQGIERRSIGRGV